MNKRNSRQPSQRQLRVGEELRHVLAQVLERRDFRDPLLAAAHVTVTAVDASPDLRTAIVFVVPLGGGGLIGGTDQPGAERADNRPPTEVTREIIDGLNRASAFIRGQVAGQMRLRYMPAFTFRLDASFDHAHHIDRLLHDPKVARDLVVADDDADDDQDDTRETS